MGLGNDLVFLLVLGLVFLGPRQMHAMLRTVARMKAEFDRASRDLKQQLTAELGENESSGATPYIERPSARFSKPADVRGQWL
jgi:Sec-independent protein translocase protein TatA